MQDGAPVDPASPPEEQLHWMIDIKPGTAVKLRDPWLLCRGVDSVYLIAHPSPLGNEQGEVVRLPPLESAGILMALYSFRLSTTRVALPSLR